MIYKDINNEIIKVNQQIKIYIRNGHTFFGKVYEEDGKLYIKENKFKEGYGRYD